MEANGARSEVIGPCTMVCLSLGREMIMFRGAAGAVASVYIPAGDVGCAAASAVASGCVIMEWTMRLTIARAVAVVDVVYAAPTALVVIVVITSFVAAATAAASVIVNAGCGEIVVFHPFVVAVHAAIVGDVADATALVVDAVVVVVVVV